MSPTAPWEGAPHPSHCLYIHNEKSPFCRRYARPFSCLKLHDRPYLVTLQSIAIIMSCLQIIPVLRSGSCGGIAEFFPSTNRLDLIDHKRQRMPCVTRLVVVNRSKLPFTDTALTSSCLHPCPVLSPERSILVPWICCHSLPRFPLLSWHQKSGLLLQVAPVL